MNREYTIEGMHCAGCAAGIQATVARMKGVDNATVSYAGKTLTLTYNEGAFDEDTLYKTIKDMGYTLIARTDDETATFDIKGMHCAGCAATIQNALPKTKGISAVAVSFPRETCVVTYNPFVISIDDVAARIGEIGYTAVPHDDDEHDARDIHDEETRYYGARLPFLIALGTLLLPVSMAEMFLTIPNALVPAHLIAQALLATTMIALSWHYYTTGMRALFITRVPTMNTLVALGTGSAYIFSLVNTIRFFAGAEPPFTFYYEAAGMVLLFITVGKYLESKAKWKTGDAIRALMHQAPKKATRIDEDESEHVVPVSRVVKGNVLRVKAGEHVPVDGIVIEGRSALDESMVTGESLPVEKAKDDTVIGGTVNTTGSFTMRAENVGKETMLAQIIAMVKKAEASRAPVQDLADWIAARFVPAIIVIALAAGSAWLIAGKPLSFAVTVTVSILSIACACALGLAVPIAIMMGVGLGAKYGILIKDADALQKAHTITAVVFDKTGTLTIGKPSVTDVITREGVTEDTLISYANALEIHTSHPIARAIDEKANALSSKQRTATSVETVAGKGVRGVIDRVPYIIGNKAFLDKEGIPYTAWADRIRTLEAAGKSVMLLAGKDVLGIIAVRDVLRDKSELAVRRLTKQGLSVIMLSGDNERTARAVAKEIGITRVIANVHPTEKAAAITALQEEGEKVAMVGDGMNDAPALKQADVGFAIAAGTDVALEAGDFVLVRNNPLDVETAFSLSRYTMRKMKQNLFWAFIYNILAIPIAAGVLYPVTGFLLSPMIAGLAMSLSSLSVVLNTLLMNTFRPRHMG